MTEARNKPNAKDFDNAFFPVQMRGLDPARAAPSLVALVEAIQHCRSTCSPNGYDHAALQAVGRAVMSGGALMALVMRAEDPLEDHILELQERLAQHKTINGAWLRSYVERFWEREGRGPTCAEAAIAFSTTASNVECAVFGEYWLFTVRGWPAKPVAERVIEMDGE